MNHIVDMCPLTKFEGGLKLLRKADNDGVVAEINSDQNTRKMT